MEQHHLAVGEHDGRAVHRRPRDAEAIDQRGEHRWVEQPAQPIPPERLDRREANRLQVVTPRGRQQSADHVRRRTDIGVDGQYPRRGAGTGLPAGLQPPGFSIPPVRYRRSGDQLYPRVAGRICQHELSGAVSGATVHDQDFGHFVTALDESFQARSEPRLLVQHGYDHGDPLGDVCMPAVGECPSVENAPRESPDDREQGYALEPGEQRPSLPDHASPPVTYWPMSRKASSALG